MDLIQLRGGDSAPQFTATDALGKLIDLADYSDKFVLLVFLRYSGCPLCNLTLHRLIMEYPMLSDNGCEVVAFVQSDAEHIKRDIYGRHKQPPQFPIIPDESRIFYDKYGVRNTSFAKGLANTVLETPYWLKSAFEFGYKPTKIDGDALLVPASFLVGPGSQEIVQAEYGSSFYDHRTFTSIYEPLIFK